MNLGETVHAKNVLCDTVLVRQVGSAARPVSELHVAGEITTHSIGSTANPVRTIHMASDFVIQDDLKFTSLSSGQSVARISTSGTVDAAGVRFGLGADALALRDGGSGELEVTGRGTLLTSGNRSTVVDDSEANVPTCSAVQDAIAPVAALGFQNYNELQTLDTRYVQPAALTNALAPYVTREAVENDFLGVDAIAGKFAFTTPPGGNPATSLFTVETDAGTAIHVYSTFMHWYDETFFGNNNTKGMTSLVTPQWILEKDEAIQATYDTRYGSLSAQQSIDQRVTALEGGGSSSSALEPRVAALETLIDDTSGTTTVHSDVEVAVIVNGFQRVTVTPLELQTTGPIVLTTTPNILSTDGRDLKLQRDGGQALVVGATALYKGTTTSTDNELMTRADVESMLAAGGTLRTAIDNDFNAQLQSYVPISALTTAPALPTSTDYTFVRESAGIYHITFVDTWNATHFAGVPNYSILLDMKSFRIGSSVNEPGHMFAVDWFNKTDTGFSITVSEQESDLGGSDDVGRDVQLNFACIRGSLVFCQGALFGFNGGSKL